MLGHFPLLKPSGFELKRALPLLVLVVFALWGVLVFLLGCGECTALLPIIFLPAALELAAQPFLSTPS